MSRLALQIDDGPVFLPLFQVFEPQGDGFGRRRPQASSSARSARSRLPFRSVSLGACQSARLCWSLSQLPRRTPRFLTPFTRRIPAARSALRSPDLLLRKRGAGRHPIEG